MATLVEAGAVNMSVAAEGVTNVTNGGSTSSSSSSSSVGEAGQAGGGYHNHQQQQQQVLQQNYVGEGDSRSNLSRDNHAESSPLKLQQQVQQQQQQQPLSPTRQQQQLAGMFVGVGAGGGGGTTTTSHHKIANTTMTTSNHSVGSRNSKQLQPQQQQQQSKPRISLAEGLQNLPNRRSNKRGSRRASTGAGAGMLMAMPGSCNPYHPHNRRASVSGQPTGGYMEGGGGCDDGYGTDRDEDNVSLARSERSRRSRRTIQSHETLPSLMTIPPDPLHPHYLGGGNHNNKNTDDDSSSSSSSDDDDDEDVDDDNHSRLVRPPMLLAAGPGRAPPSPAVAATTRIMMMPPNHSYGIGAGGPAPVVPLAAAPVAPLVAAPPLPPPAPAPSAASPTMAAAAAAAAAAWSQSSPPVTATAVTPTPPPQQQQQQQQQQQAPVATALVTPSYGQELHDQEPSFHEDEQEPEEAEVVEAEQEEMEVVEDTNMTNSHDDHHSYDKDKENLQGQGDTHDEEEDDDDDDEPSFHGHGYTTNEYAAYGYGFSQQQQQYQQQYYMKRRLSGGYGGYGGGGRRRGSNDSSVICRRGSNEGCTSRRASLSSSRRGSWGEQSFQSTGVFSRRGSTGDASVYSLNNSSANLRRGSANGGGGGGGLKSLLVMPSSGSNELSSHTYHAGMNYAMPHNNINSNIPYWHLQQHPQHPYHHPHPSQAHYSMQQQHPQYHNQNHPANTPDFVPQPLQRNDTGDSMVLARGGRGLISPNSGHQRTYASTARRAPTPPKAGRRKSGTHLVDGGASVGGGLDGASQPQQQLPSAPALYGAVSPKTTLRRGRRPQHNQQQQQQEPPPQQQQQQQQESESLHRSSGHEPVQAQQQQPTIMMPRREFTTPKPAGASAKHTRLYRRASTGSPHELPGAPTTAAQQQQQQQAYQSVPPQHAAPANPYQYDHVHHHPPPGPSAHYDAPGARIALKREGGPVFQQPQYYADETMVEAHARIAQRRASASAAVGSGARGGGYSSDSPVVVVVQVKSGRRPSMTATAAEEMGQPRPPTPPKSSSRLPRRASASAAAATTTTLPRPDPIVVQQQRRLSGTGVTPEQQDAPMARRLSGSGDVSSSQQQPQQQRRPSGTTTAATTRRPSTGAGNMPPMSSSPQQQQQRRLSGNHLNNNNSHRRLSGTGGSNTVAANNQNNNNSHATIPSDEVICVSPVTPRKPQVVQQPQEPRSGGNNNNNNNNSMVLPRLNQMDQAMQSTLDVCKSPPQTPRRFASQQQPTSKQPTASTLAMAPVLTRSPKDTSKNNKDMAATVERPQSTRDSQNKSQEQHQGGITSMFSPMTPRGSQVPAAKNMAKKHGHFSSMFAPSTPANAAGPSASPRHRGSPRQRNSPNKAHTAAMLMSGGANRHGTTGNDANRQNDDADSEMLTPMREHGFYGYTAATKSGPSKGGILHAIQAPPHMSGDGMGSSDMLASHDYSKGSGLGNSEDTSSTTSSKRRSRRYKVDDPVRHKAHGQLHNPRRGRPTLEDALRVSDRELEVFDEVRKANMEEMEEASLIHVPNDEEVGAENDRNNAEDAPRNHDAVEDVVPDMALDTHRHVGADHTPSNVAVTPSELYSKKDSFLGSTSAAQSDNNIITNNNNNNNNNGCYVDEQAMVPTESKLATKQSFDEEMEPRHPLGGNWGDLRIDASEDSGSINEFMGESSLYEDSKLKEIDKYKQRARRRASMEKGCLDMSTILESKDSALKAPKFKPATGCTNASDFVVRCFAARLRTGITVIKHNRSRWSKSTYRDLFLLPDGKSLSWKPIEGEADKGKRPKLDLTKCLEVRHAWSRDPTTRRQTGTAILRKRCKDGMASKSFSLIFAKRTLDITALSNDQCKVLLDGFSALCFRLQLEKLEEEPDVESRIGDRSGDGRSMLSDDDWASTVYGGGSSISMGAPGSMTKTETVHMASWGL